MNILPIVVSILMLMAIMTYTRLQGFLTTEAVRTEAVCYMQSMAALYTNEAQEKNYTDSKNPRAPKGQLLKSDADKRLNLGLFSIQEVENKNSAYVPVYTALIKRLIHAIYYDRDYYQEMEEKRPGFLDELWQEVVTALKNQEQAGSPVTKPKQLGNLSLADSELQEIFTKMLKESPDLQSLSEECREKRQGQMAKLKIAYLPTLIDFLYVNKTRIPPIRIYLAERPLLVALFQDEGVADEIISARQDLYRVVSNVPSENLPQAKGSATAQFRDQFLKFVPSNIPPELVNFDVSTTLPP